MSGLRVIFLGAPGVGKGSFANKIGPKFGLPIVSTGDLVRAEIKSGSELGKRIKALNDAGKLVDDDTIVGMAQKKITGMSGFILDGFPRTVRPSVGMRTFVCVYVYVCAYVCMSVFVHAW